MNGRLVVPVIAIGMALSGPAYGLGGSVGPAPVGSLATSEVQVGSGPRLLVNEGLEKALSIEVGSPPEQTLSPFSGSADQVRGAVGEVLARPEFQRARPNAVARAQAWVAAKIERLLLGLSGGGRGAVVVGVIALLGLLALAASTLRFARGVTSDGGRSRRSGPAPIRTAAQWREEAETHERHGQWRSAVRCRYRAMVAELAEAGLVEEVPGRTAGEYRIEIAGTLPEASVALAGATELFENAWYGHRPTEEREAADFRQLADQVLTVGRHG